MMTIEQAAKEAEELNAEENRDFSQAEEFIDGFLQGVEFAQRWIPVEEENPPKDEAINEFGFNASITVEVRNEFKIQSAYFKFDTGQWRSLITGNIINPTHFRLIELK